MYEAIKQSMMEEFNPLQDTSSLSMEEAYEVLYRLVTRLSDMDDFDTKLLRRIYDTMTSESSESSDEAFIKAFNQVVDADYEFADADYFKDALNTYKKDLKEALIKSINSGKPSNTWNAEINWLFNHAVINVDGTDYTLPQLKKLLDEEGE